MKNVSMSRRRFLTASGVAGAGLLVSGCDALDAITQRGGHMRGILESAEWLTYRAQRLLVGESLAQEFTEADIRQPMRPNGVTHPQDADYLDLQAAGFESYRLAVEGLVERPLSLSLGDVRAMPARTQITRHDCVEGWSCIAKWTGVPLAAVLDRAGVRREARFVVFHCFDTIERSLAGEVKYYESIDMIDARHPQTILAYGMNDTLLPIENGAPLRVRVERQLGYKMAKYIRRIELVENYVDIGEGRGSYWADRGYEWYAGI
ncbi:molybdopterin-dependent oxidoreductase [Mesorhizobium sp. YIM 152430]|uniref:molybdopterin-dependent oxidoreductase n=1 Tax=Mesorhizobium sp. YIM 152430 TaxID=3031761 RepID=UPI0023D9EDEB|nr:molybdopterin-dependent oxidoreductase [Mesorhizobium sp. YIM 152430]MDF1599162.1 molybdopterin-dependent oxidoreductase [Mesorhizobium sp. YIM 152430]